MGLIGLAYVDVYNNSASKHDYLNTLWGTLASLSVCGITSSSE